MPKKLEMKLHLWYEDGSYSLIERGAIHVDGRSDWENKTANPGIHLKVKVLMESESESVDGRSDWENNGIE